MSGQKKEEIGQNEEEKPTGTNATNKFVNREESFNPEEMIDRLNGELKRQCLMLLKTLQKNKQTKGEEITKEEVKTLIEITETIAQNTQGWAREETFKSLNTLISNPNFTPQLLPTIHTIAQNTKGKATTWAFESLNNLISHKDFTIEWIEQYWNPTFDAIIKNTKGEATEEAFEALRDKIKQSTIKAEIIFLSLIIRTRFKNLKDEELVEAIKNIDISEY
jgi:hypothetical protein